MYSAKVNAEELLKEKVICMVDCSYMILLLFFLNSKKTRCNYYSKIKACSLHNLEKSVSHDLCFVSKRIDSLWNKYFV